MKRSTFFKSLAVLCGVAISKPLELFGEKKETDFEKWKRIWNESDIKIPDWVKKVSFHVKGYYVYEDGHRTTFLANADGKLVDLYDNKPLKSFTEEYIESNAICTTN